MPNVYDDKNFFSAYSQMSRSRGGLASAGEWHILEPLFPDLRGRAVLDLGCGYGWHCKYAAEHGARSVLGIDLSEKMIERATSLNSDPKITYRVCDIGQYEYPDAAYELVISNLALHYIENLDSVFKSVRKTLCKNGIFLFNIEHPVFSSAVNEEWVYDKSGKPLFWPVDNYFYPGGRTTNFLGLTVKKQHHTLTQIITGLLQNGFELEALQEPMPSEQMMKLPEMKGEMRRPMMLIIRAKAK